MSSHTSTDTAITEIVRSRMAAVPLNTIVGQPTLPAVRKLVEQLSAFAAHFHTTEWVGRHGHLALVLNQKKNEGGDGRRQPQLRPPPETCTRQSNHHGYDDRQ